MWTSGLPRLCGGRPVHVEGIPSERRHVPCAPPGKRIQRRRAMTQYVEFGIFLITVPNLIIIIAMLIVFAFGLWLKLPGHTQD